MAKNTTQLTTTTPATEAFVANLPAESGLSGGEKAAIGIAIGAGVITLGAVGAWGYTKIKEYNENKKSYYNPYYPQHQLGGPVYPQQVYPYPVPQQPQVETPNQYPISPDNTPDPTEPGLQQPNQIQQVIQQPQVQPQMQAPVVAPQQPVQQAPVRQPDLVTLTKEDYDKLTQSTSIMSEQLSMASEAMKKTNDVLAAKDAEIEKFQDQANKNYEFAGSILTAALAAGVPSEFLSQQTGLNKDFIDGYKPANVELTNQIVAQEKAKEKAATQQKKTTRTTTKKK